MVARLYILPWQLIFYLVLIFALMESPCGAAAGERQGCSSTFYPPSNEFLMQMYMFFIKLTTNIKKKIDILLIFDVQGKKSLLAKEQRENIKNTDYPFIFTRFLLRAPQPSEAPPLLARIASNGHREICG